MSFDWTRRAFLRSALGLSAGSMLATCSPTRRDGGSPDDTRPTIVSRPIVRPYGAEAVWMASPTVDLPVAYVSMATRQVFVDRDFRDRASWLLDAHISVSTGVWRIPLASDSPLVPISPGDEQREFAELTIGAWNPSVDPASGDIRILRGRRASVEIEGGCLPIQGTTDWLTGSTVRIERSDRSPMGTTREDFGVVASGLRTSERDCAGTGVEVQILTWACR